VATALSVAVMIVAMAIVTGFSASISEKLFSFMGHVHVLPFDMTRGNTLTYTEPIYYDTALEAKMKSLEYVAAVWPFAERPVIVQAHGQMEGVVLKGVDSNYRFMKGITLTGDQIDYRDSAYSKQICLSATTANRLNINLGDTVQLDFIENEVPRIRRVRVCGIYHSGMEEVDKRFGVCDLRLLQRINNWSKDSINGFQLDLTDNAYADSVSAYLHYNVIKPPLESYTTMENYSSLFEWLALQKMSGAILLTIMAIVAIINMGAVLVILMVDRARMVGLLKALGMQFGTTRNIFLSIAALIGASGILLGNIIALAICWLQLRFGFLTLNEEVYYMHYVPIKINWLHIGVIDIVTLLLCVICMLLPVLYIRRIQPAKALQFK